MSIDISEWILVGIGFLPAFVFPIILDIVDKQNAKVYSEIVSAKVVDVSVKIERIRHGGRIQVYYPTFQYEYKGESYLVKAGYGHYDKRVFVKGSVMQIRIVPTAPEKTRYEGKNEIYSTFWGGAGILLMIYILIRVIRYFV